MRLLRSSLSCAALLCAFLLVSTNALPLHSVAALASTQAASLGPRTIGTPCAWIASPGTGAGDSNAHYWSTEIAATASVSFTINGTFPASRYTSIQAYTNSNFSLDGIHDVQYPADPGSSNPFATKGPRGTGAYTLHLVVLHAPPQTRAPGTLYAVVPDGTPLIIYYRVYLPDTTQPNGATQPMVQGWVPLPSMTAYDSANGASLDCPQSTAPIPQAPPPGGSPPPGFSLNGAFYHLPVGLFPNDDNAYLGTNVNDTTNLTVVRFQPPTTPRTLAGQALDTGTQLRYWSVCVYYAPPLQPLVVNNTNACTPDELAPVDSDGKVTVIVAPDGSSAPAGLPPVTWISMDKPVSYTILLRNMLPNSAGGPNFAAQQLNYYDQANSQTLGSYAPTIAQCSRAQLQSCLPAPAPSPTPIVINTPVPPPATVTPVPPTSTTPPPPAPTTAVVVLPSATSTPIAAACSAVPASLSLHVNQRSVRRGDTLHANLSTASGAHVSVTLQVTTTTLVITGKGTAQKKVKKTVVLYHIVRKGTADAKGRLDLSIPVGYDPAASVKAALSASAQAACGSTAQHTSVTIDPLITFHASATRITTGATLTVGAHTLARAQVSVTLQVTTTKLVVTGTGKSQKKVKKTTVLYRVAYKGTADKYGAFVHKLRVTYRPSRATTATLTVTMQAGHRTASRVVSVTVQPPKR